MGLSRLKPLHFNQITMMLWLIFYQDNDLGLGLDVCGDLQ